MCAPWQFSTVFTGPWREGWRLKRLDRGRGAACIRERREVSPFHRKPELCVCLCMMIHDNWAVKSSASGSTHGLLLVSLILPSSPTIRINSITGRPTTYQNKKEGHYKLSLSKKKLSVCVRYINMVFLFSSMTLLLKQCCASCAIASNLKLGLKLSMTQQICAVTTVASCFEPYLHPSVQWVITREITATHFRRAELLSFHSFPLLEAV